MTAPLEVDFRQGSHHSRADASGTVDDEKIEWRTGNWLAEISDVDCRRFRVSPFPEHVDCLRTVDAVYDSSQNENLAEN